MALHTVHPLLWFVTSSFTLDVQQCSLMRRIMSAYSCTSAQHIRTNTNVSKECNCDSVMRAVCVFHCPDCDWQVVCVLHCQG